MEQHGPHLPVATDSLIAEEVALRAAVRAGTEVIVAPTLSLGHSPYHMHLAGTLSLGIATLSAVIRDVCTAVHSHGFNRILLLNGHGGNVAVLDGLVYELATNGVYVAGASWWSFAQEAISTHLTSELGGANHACELETSVMLHIAPQLVQMDQAVRDLARPQTRWSWRDFRPDGIGPVTFPLIGEAISNSGVYGDPTVATADKGAAIVEEVVCNLAAFLSEFCSWIAQER
jgi:creatinine amidohydrolase